MDYPALEVDQSSDSLQLIKARCVCAGSRDRPLSVEQQQQQLGCREEKNQLKKKKKSKLVAELDRPVMQTRHQV